MIYSPYKPDRLIFVSLFLSALMLGWLDTESADARSRRHKSHKPRASSVRSEHRAALQRHQGGSAIGGIVHPIAFTVENMKTDEQFNRAVMEKVDKAVRTKLFSEDLARNVWPQALEKHKQEILASENLAQLSERMNRPIKELKKSHCQFVTINDETYYFLHSMFSANNRRLRIPDSDFVGFVTGGVKCEPNEVRYVLDGSPAAAAGLKPGDRILTVDNEPYIGQSNFFGKSGKQVEIAIKASGAASDASDALVQGASRTITVKPVKRDWYSEYVKAIEKSVTTTKTPEGTIGYIHLWSGGGRSHDMFDSCMGEKLAYTDGLILDLRSGYGGNGLEDLDFFFRPPNAYPDFVAKMRDGRKVTVRHYYDKPIVALINGGSRSGKELLAYSLKRSKRATLLGESTAGAVLAGMLIPINERCSLYLAVQEAEINGEKLEGVGVKPDIEVVDERLGADRQLDRAKLELLQKLRDSRDKKVSGKSGECSLQVAKSRLE